MTRPSRRVQLVRERGDETALAVREILPVGHVVAGEGLAVGSGGRGRGVLGGVGHDEHSTR